ncbi:hypothetical protein CYY_002873 [Polysphondylium violaceum]|uniref:PQ-loop repeat-containing protein n=1 Tax=Polysphondylium violaceum TaxID=133409 RepID=A0A8J4V987_9MYCE|nr:hypothetical protein CYY_002873 [Polysphondylium violaceum]
MSATSNNFECKTSFETIDIVLGFALTIGIVISFLPQVIVMILRKNVDGLSVISCWFNYANCMATFLNVLFLNWFVFECCNWMTSWVCFENLLPVIQMLSPFFSTLVIFILYVIYRPRLPPYKIDENTKINSEENTVNYNNSNINPNNDEQKSINNNEVVIDDAQHLSSSPSINNNNSNSNDNSPRIDNDSPLSQSSTDAMLPQNQKSKKNFVDQESFHLKKGSNKIETFFIKCDWYSQPFFWGSIIASFIFFFIGVGVCVQYGSKSKSLEGYAFSMGILASVLVFFQWIPQIYTTWISDEIGSLSLSSLCIQAPGALLVVYFQLDAKQNWSTWFPYLATAVQEIILIVICSYYIVRDKRKKKRLAALEQVQDAQLEQEQAEQVKSNMDKGIEPVGDKENFIYHSDNVDADINPSSNQYNNEIIINNADNLNNQINSSNNNNFNINSFE